MSTFAIVYHVSGSDQKPQESIEAETLQEAGEIVAKKFESGSVVAVPSGEDLIVIPQASVAYCHIRHIQERRRAVARTRNPFEGIDDDEETTLETVAAG